MKNQSLGYRLFTIANYLFITMLALATLYPYLNTLAVALNDGGDTMLGGVTFYPRMPTLENFTTILSSESMLRALFVSVLQTVLGTLLGLIVQFTAAYALTKRRLVGRTGILLYLTIPMFITGGLIPTYLLYSNLQLLNTLWVYVLPGAFSFFNVIIIRTYMYTLPESLEESAKIDGAGEWKILWRIVLPLCRPILATIALWTAVANWNDWTTTLYFITKSNLQTLQYKLMLMIKESEMIARLMQEAIERGETVPNYTARVTSESIRAAQVIITTIPIILVYPFLQKHFIKGVLIGSVKE
ncbi:carbohydrate ABC transporter permease [Paenibacillus sp. IB182496]|uniref:Carbohydrate ABC transporter permease n=1 Tax=Paenibacillus sabuli TaxID=2772509 RepID=A0A927GSX0_9BACL|nr:carbohydrate ABC transporter permease [Paenibacillus sabuli]MBD2847008.1 carbohydrate ABC transporter permease [Paenibacillus sabuli]